MPPKRIAFTGGSGKVGRYVVKELLKYGHEIINLDLVPAPDLGVYSMKVDMTNAGEVFSALNTHMGLGEPFPAETPRVVDTVIHFAGLSTPMIASDSETFRTNVLGMHNVIEAACKLGIKKIIIASSVTVYGVAFGQGHIEYPSFPIDEELDVNPTDPYALSKVCGEKIARS